VIINGNSCDLNAGLETKVYQKIIGTFGEISSNGNGNQFRQFAVLSDLRLTNIEAACSIHVWYS
jgi:hypothetical protein